MEDIRCTQCNQLIGKNLIIRYGEFKCPRCKTINVIDRDLTTQKKESIMNQTVTNSSFEGQ